MNSDGLVEKCTGEKSACKSTKLSYVMPFELKTVGNSCFFCSIIPPFSYFLLSLELGLLLVRFFKSLPPSHIQE